MSTSIPLSRVKPPCPPQVLVDRVDDAELAGQPLDAQPVGDREPRRVVGEHQVLVAELDRGERHLLDRRAAVGPVGVRVQVAAQPGPQLLAALDERPAVLRLELGQPLRQHAADRGADHLGGARRRCRPGRSACPASTRLGDLVGRPAAGSPPRRCGTPGPGGSPPGRAPSGSAIRRSAATGPPVVRRACLRVSAPPPERDRLQVDFLSTPGGRHRRWSAARTCPPAVHVLPSPGPGRPTGYPQAPRAVVHRLIHRSSGPTRRHRVDPVAGRLLAWTTDGAPGRRTAFARGRHSGGPGTWGPLLATSPAPMPDGVTAGAPRDTTLAGRIRCPPRIIGGEHEGGGVPVAPPSPGRRGRRREPRGSSATRRARRRCRPVPAPRLTRGLGTPRADALSVKSARFHAQRCAVHARRPRCRRVDDDRVAPVGPVPAGFPDSPSRRPRTKRARRPSWRRPGAASSTA